MHRTEEELTGQLSIEQFRPLYDSLVEQGEVTEAFDNAPSWHYHKTACQASFEFSQAHPALLCTGQKRQRLEEILQSRGRDQAPEAERSPAKL